MTMEDIIKKMINKEFLSVEDEEKYMQEIYDSTIGEIEEHMFLTPNWIVKKEERDGKRYGFVDLKEMM